MPNAVKMKRVSLGACAGIIGLFWVYLLSGCAKEEYRFSGNTQMTGEEPADTQQMEYARQEIVDNSQTVSEQSDPVKNVEGQDEPENGGASGHVGVCYVHICGAVAQPGVYCVDEGSRLYEVILLAGGLTEDAADQAVNQAQELTDGMQIYIPTQEEVQSGIFSGQTQSYRTEETQDTRVNINTADEKLLCTLPGIGTTRAEAIISYRNEHGEFRNNEEFMNVTGIKAGVYEKIKELIKV